MPEIREYIERVRGYIEKAEIQAKMRTIFIDEPGLVILMWIGVLFLPLGNFVVWDAGYLCVWYTYGFFESPLSQWHIILVTTPEVISHYASLSMLLTTSSILVFANTILLTIFFRRGWGSTYILVLSAVCVCFAIGFVTIISATNALFSIQTIPILPTLELLLGIVITKKPQLLTPSRMDPRRQARSAKGFTVLRGAEFVGNRLRFKIKVMNNSDVVFTDVTISIAAYPKESLKIDSEITKVISKIEPKGFRSPTFDFLPTSDCVQGDIIATVSYVDFTGQVNVITSEPYTVRSVCDLLEAQEISQEDFKLKLDEMKCGEFAVKVKDWTPEEMHSKTLQVIQQLNFYEVENVIEPTENAFQSTIFGWSRGKYTGKNVGVKISIMGNPGEYGATAKITMSGEDEAMIMPAIDEIAQALSAWICPMCNGKLPTILVEELKKGKSVECPFCGVTMNR